MNQFEYTRVSTAKSAVEVLTKNSNAYWIAGGTNLIDLMKKGVVNAERLIDINGLPLKEIVRINGVLRIGALALNSDVAENAIVRDAQPLLSLALQAGASQQLRNMATIGGNMMQRTRCPYFYNPDMPCNKREPGSGCGALQGYNRMHAIFGASEKCIAVHPSDMCVALAALDATVLVAGPRGERRIPFAEFHRLPGDTPQQDHNLSRGELITSVEIPDNRLSKHVHYLKVRDRSSYAFALVSVAAALELDGNSIRDVRLCMGGVAHKPWRMKEAEEFLKGKVASEENFRQAATIAMRGGKGYGHNNFKVSLGANSILDALKTATAKA